MKPLLPAVYQPQVWVDDDAVDVGGRIEFDAAPAFFEQRPATMLKISKEILAERNDVDELADGVSDHDGPFLVSVDSGDFSAFLALHGVRPDADELSEASVARTKHADPSKSKELLAEFDVDADAFSDVLLAGSWDAYATDGWYQNMPPASVREIESGETQSIFVARSEDGYDVRIGEMHAHSTTYPSLSLAMRAGNAAIAKADEDLPSVVARDLGIDPEAFDIDIHEQSVVFVAPKGEEHPNLWISENRVSMSPDPSEDREYRTADRIRLAVEEFKQALTPAPAP